MIVHMVLMRVRRNVQMMEVQRAFAALAGLQRQVPGILGFSVGPNISPEALERGFTHGFTMGFKDVLARDGYLHHPETARVRGLLLSVLEGGVDGLLVFDYSA
jgi:hypothetical protein